MNKRRTAELVVLFSYLEYDSSKLFIPLYIKSLLFVDFIIHI